ncbi:MAG: hypothetical protein WD045_12350 [Pirellulaceae bacterium]
MVVPKETEREGVVAKVTVRRPIVRVKVDPAKVAEIARKQDVVMGTGPKRDARADLAPAWDAQGSVVLKVLVRKDVERAVLPPVVGKLKVAVVVDQAHGVINLGRSESGKTRHVAVTSNAAPAAVKVRNRALPPKHNLPQLRLLKLSQLKRRLPSQPTHPPRTPRPNKPRQTI